MILSMTGFGRGIAETSTKKITVEIKSLNSKQLDLFMKVPNFLREMEIEIRKEISPALERGKVEMTVSLENLQEATSSRLNLEALKNYKCQIENMGRELSIPEPSDWYATLLRLPDAWQTRTDDLSQEERAAFVISADTAVKSLIEFRIAEGKKLYDFFCEKIVNIRGLLKSIEPFEKERIEKIRNRLEEQLSSLPSVDYDRGRLEQELIFYIEKLDVTEEKLRLNSHLDYFQETMGNREDARTESGQGKKLGFIAQEMGREINTLGSKSNNAEMQRIVVKMKDELEQIKEQVLNVL